ncbi:MAG: hypothetical protein Q8Q59_04120 [Luteolibacter sp.]|nr:hypothetical protein [Luteolibacter sp.]
MKITAAFGIIFLTSAVSIANPAVSEINGKFGAMHGSMDSESMTSLEGSITWPIQECFGMQLDGLYSTIGQRAYGYARVDDIDFGGLGAHFFWRDSETAMVGLEAGYVFSDPVDSWELGIEAERYFEWLTLGAKAGVASIRFESSSTLIETDKDAFFCQFYLGAYPMDDLWISLIAENRFDNTFFGLEVEYELPVAGLSIFANAMKGDHGYDHALIGMKYYFGEDKPLKNRHRESDPKNHLHGIRYGIGTYQAEIHEQVVKSVSHVDSGTGASIGGSGSIGGQPGGGTVVIGPGNSPGGGTLTIGPGNSPGGGTLTIGPGSSPGGGTLTIGPGSGFSFDIP